MSQPEGYGTPMTEAELLALLANAALRYAGPAPTLVAIDGRSAAGKTTLADALAVQIQAHGRVTLRSSLDDFHPPGHKYRSRERRYSPESYYREGYDYAAFQRLVLEPLQKGGSRRCQLALWDSFHDCALPESWVDVPDDAIVIVDGVFLLQPGLRSFWQMAIWLEVDWQTMIERAMQRDVAWVGSAEVVAERYRTFWVPMHQYYEQLIQPQELTDLVIDNRDPAAPLLLRRAGDLAPAV